MTTIIPHRFDFYFGRIDFNDLNVVGYGNPQARLAATDTKRTINTTADYLAASGSEKQILEHNIHADHLAKMVAKAFDMRRCPHCLKYDFSDVCCHCYIDDDDDDCDDED